MKKEKLSQVLSGVILVVLGILIAIFGAANVLDTYFGIIACVAGALLLCYAIYLLVKKQAVVPSTFILPCVLLAVGICLFTPWLSVGFVFDFLAVIAIGAGAGLIFFGAYLIAKKNVFGGILNIAVGAVVLTLAVLYKAVPEFAKAFWIIIGVLVAVYGVLMIVSAFLGKKK